MPVDVLGDNEIIIDIVPSSGQVLAIATPSYRVNLGSITILRYRFIGSGIVKRPGFADIEPRGSCAY